MIKFIKKHSRLFTILLLLLLVGGIVMSLDSIQERLNKEGEKRLYNAIQKAAITCYSVEGRYPASLEYLVENYGVIVDAEKYHVYYETFGSNVQPEIKIYQR